MPFQEERLRDEARGRAVVVVGIDDVVRVELELAVVEVEDRRVRELAIGLKVIVSTHLTH